MDFRMLAALDAYQTAMTIIAVFASAAAVVLFVLWKRRLPDATRQGIDVDEALRAI